MATKKKLGYAGYRLKPLQIITAEAKKIQAANPKLKWVDAIKKASVKYRSGSVAAPSPSRKAAPAKKAAPVKKVAKKKASTKPVQAKLFGSKKPAGIQTKSRSHTDYNKPTVNIQIGSLEKRQKFAFALGMRDGIEGNIRSILADIERTKTKISSAKNVQEKNNLKKQLVDIKKELIYYKGQLTKQNQHIKSLMK